MVDGTFSRTRHLGVMGEFENINDDIQSIPKPTYSYKSSSSVIEDPLFKQKLEENLPQWLYCLDKGYTMLQWWDYFKRQVLLLMKQTEKISKDIFKEKEQTLQFKLNYLLEKVHNNENDSFDEYNRQKKALNDLYFDHIQARAQHLYTKDLEESESYSVFHRENHRKRQHQSYIVKLETPLGVITGHENCSNYLTDELEKLLQPIQMDKKAQEKLLKDVETVFSEQDVKFLSDQTTMEEVKHEVWTGNLTGAPGTDGIILLFYKVHWDLIKDLLFRMVKENRENNTLTVSQAMGLIVFGNKPNKKNSILPKDKRRISLLNTDYKICSGIPTTRLNKVSKVGLSEHQYVQGGDRNISHCVNKARDTIVSGSTSKDLCAIQENDFKSAFDFMMSEWPIMVLKKKGCGDKFAEWIGTFFKEVYSTVVINKVRGAIIRLLRSLRQGDKPSMLLFAYGIDPFLTRLNKNLPGILICKRKMKVFGPLTATTTTHDTLMMEERFKAEGFADDVKTGITCIDDMITVDNDTKLFERASGCELHRDVNCDKVKIMPIGKWRKTLKPEIIPEQVRHVKVTTKLDMLGVTLTAIKRETLKQNGEFLQRKIRNTTSTWQGRTMGVKQKSISVNALLYPKIYHRARSVPMRVGDITQFKRAGHRFIYSEQVERPMKIVNHMAKEDGGLGVHDPLWKAKAFLTRCFLETAMLPGYNNSLYHTALYDQNVLGEVVTPKPAKNPYLDENFFNNIKRAIEDNEDPLTMKTKDWYNYFLSKDLHENNTGDKKLCKIEIKHPDWNWSLIWKRITNKLILDEQKSFLWNFMHDLLPTNERKSITQRNTLPICGKCTSNNVDNILQHTFTSCTYSSDVMKWLQGVLSNLDIRGSLLEIITMRFGTTKSENELPCVWLTAETLQTAWSRRIADKPAPPITLAPMIKSKLMKVTKSYKHRQMANILLEALAKFDARQG